MVVYISFMTQWCGNGVISYYLSLILDTVGITSSTEKTLINGILQIVSWVAAITGGLLVDRVGRRPLWLFSITGMMISYISWTACSAVYETRQTQPLAVAVLVLVFLFQIHYSVAITPLSAGRFLELMGAFFGVMLTLVAGYPVEILPFYSRQKAMGISYIGNSFANLFNSFATPVALEGIGWKYYTVYIVLLAQFLVVVYLFFPETRGYGLEQISDLFESDKFFLGKVKLQHESFDRREDIKIGEGLKDAEVEQIETVVTRDV